LQSVIEILMPEAGEYI